MSNLKYTEEMKLEVIKYILAGHSLNQASNKFSIGRSSIQKWLGAYKIHGEEALLIKENCPNKYTGDFKISVVEYKLNHSLSIKQTIAHFNIPNTRSVALWEKKYLQEGADSLRVESRGRPKSCSTVMKNKKTSVKALSDKEILLEENKRLRMENEYLKKLNALIQNREKLNKPIK